ncbi:MAG: hypothetical protein M3R36_13935 [Bacteroidota bacterium]|nr:hypothetical protein [Bacteroidota bacterium]
MKKVTNSFLLSIIYLTIINLFIIFPQNIFSQNCSNTSVGFTPINDLGTGFFRSFQGGLYPNGLSVRPDDHDDGGLDLASKIVPLDTAGNYNPTTGKIVLLSVGMSNCSQEFLQFMQTVNGASYLNPKLVIVNGAQGGQTIDIINNPNAQFWTVIVQRLTAAGVSVKQVQAVWFKEAQSNPSDTTFPNYPYGLKDKFKICMGIMKSKYLNLKQCFSASRIYGGYATGSLNPEPYSYYSGWSVKWMIEDQINGDTSLIYKGANANSPWLSWGPYLWADGIIPRIDGLTWNCPIDYAADGTHPSTAGRQKVAIRLEDFFKTDEAAKPWFLKTVTINISAAPEGFLNPVSNTMNMRDTLTAYLRATSFPFNVFDSAKAVIDSTNLKGAFKFYNISSGTYYIQIKHRNSIETWSRAGGELLIFGAIHNYDFTNAVNKAYGNNLVLKGVKYCIYSGDVDQDGAIDITDSQIIENDAANFVSGYVSSDVNGDNFVDVSDEAISDNNSFNFVVKITP